MAESVSAETRSDGEPIPPPRRRLPIVAIVTLAIVAFFAGGIGGSFQAKLTEVQKNDNASFLSRTAESTLVANESEQFVPVQSLPGVVVFHRGSGLTDADRATVESARTAITGVAGVDIQGMTATEFSDDGTTAAVFVPLLVSRDGTDVTGDQLVTTEELVLDAARTATAGTGLAVYPAGVGGLLTAFIGAFEGIDSSLLLTALAVVVLILLVVYRSPVLWVFPLLSALLALGSASMIVYFLADADILTLNGQSQGILFVLVIGAGTDYALLLVSRYREELHTYPNRFDAMIRAWRESVGAITASAATVTVALLCLMFSELNSNKGLGPVAAIGIACTYVVMMTFLPVSLAVAGRWVFWPRRPRPDRAVDLATHGTWSRIAAWVGRHDRPAWIGTTAVLIVLCAAGIGSLHTDGLTTTESFTTTPDAVTGQEFYTEKFAPGAGAPAVVTANADAADAVTTAISGVEGIATGPGAVCPQIDYAKARALLAANPGLATAPAQGCAPPALTVAPVDGRTMINAELADSYDSPAALATIERLRDAVHAVPGADARVGGNTAATLDVQQSSVRDRNLIIPIVLAVIFVVLAVLLRSLLAPVLLIATVVLSFAATLGVSGFFFTQVFGLAGADPAFPLFAFVFLVALGIDYNIFLMTRVREEAGRHGTRAGVLRGLAVTGGVITSAGVVLAATFSVLGVLPLVFLAEIGFAVAFGVLLDTIVVRSILVPALAHDIGRTIWWPSALARGRP
ncbi:MAG: MMPL family transporter [Rhodococcus sp. (in: high G+C Gram-positive bacteria)]|uniref:MMPL family transporter n=1 Tax=Rhodococcus sp. TaxID=1831 RepID=UPI003BB744A9